MQRSKVIRRKLQLHLCLLESKLLPSFMKDYFSRFIEVIWCAPRPKSVQNAVQRLDNKQEALLRSIITGLHNTAWRKLPDRRLMTLYPFIVHKLLRKLVSFSCASLQRVLSATLKLTTLTAQNCHQSLKSAFRIKTRGICYLSSYYR